MIEKFELNYPTDPGTHINTAVYLIDVVAKLNEIIDYLNEHTKPFNNDHHIHLEKDQFTSISKELSKAEEHQDNE